MRQIQPVHITRHIDVAHNQIETATERLDNLQSVCGAVGFENVELSLIQDCPEKRANRRFVIHDETSAVGHKLLLDFSPGPYYSVRKVTDNKVLNSVYTGD
jgi:hypothetical protein